MTSWRMCAAEKLGGKNQSSVLIHLPPCESELCFCTKSARLGRVLDSRSSLLWIYFSV